MKLVFDKYVILLFIRMFNNLLVVDIFEYIICDLLLVIVVFFIRIFDWINMSMGVELVGFFR